MLSGYVRQRHHVNPATMVPAEKIRTIPMMTEANQPQLSHH